MNANRIYAPRRAGYLELQAEEARDENLKKLNESLARVGVTRVRVPAQQSARYA